MEISKGLIKKDKEEKEREELKKGKRTVIKKVE